MKKNNSLFLRLSVSALIGICVGTVFNEATSNHVDRGCIISYVYDKLGRHDESIRHTLRVINKNTKNTGLEARYINNNSIVKETMPLKENKDKSGNILSYSAPSGSVVEGLHYTVTTLKRDQYIEVTKDNEVINQIRRHY